MTLRDDEPRAGSASRRFDVLVLGGGINGAVSAAALAARGASVALIDRGDFAGFTSQQSSNLAWGGIKYLESFEFGLVRKLCLSRNHLIRSYPSTVQEIRFYAVHQRGFRHGLLEARRSAPGSTGSSAASSPGAPRLLSLARHRARGADRRPRPAATAASSTPTRTCTTTTRASSGTSSARALDYGCVAANYVESLRRAARGRRRVVVDARDVISGRERSRSARGCWSTPCGPFVDEHNALDRAGDAHRHVFSKGIHLIVDRLTPNRRVLTFFADDGRLFFVIPMGPRTCIGTTDTRGRRARSPHVTDEDRRFVLDNINKRLRLAAPAHARPTSSPSAAACARSRSTRRGRRRPTGCSSRASTSSRSTTRDAPRQHLRRQAHRLPQRGRGGLRPTSRALGVALAVPAARAGTASRRDETARRVLPPGRADGPRRA